MPVAGEPEARELLVERTFRFRRLGALGRHIGVEELPAIEIREGLRSRHSGHVHAGQTGLDVSPKGDGRQAARDACFVIDNDEDVLTRHGPLPH